MKIKEAIEFLSTFNPDSSLKLSKVIAAKQNGDRDQHPYIVRMDFPIIGAAEQDGEVLLVIEGAMEVIALGKDIRRLDGSPLTTEDIELIKT